MYRSGFLGLIGQPNAGKSSLMNFLVNEKVSIVTNKPQTTRRRILGISSHKEAQIIFVDAPGVINADKGLNGFLAKEAQDVIRQSDALLAILSLDEKKPEDAEKVISMVSDSRKPWLGIVTKTDLGDKIHRLNILKNMIEAKNGKAHFISIFKANKEDRELLLKDMELLLPESPAPLYGSDLFTNESVKDLATEIIREKCFESLSQELPYNIAVRIIRFDELDKLPKIHAEILVSKRNHKTILIGKNADMIKKIGILSRKEIEKLMGEKIFLELNVTFKENWYLNPAIMKELGYVIRTE